MILKRGGGAERKKMDYHHEGLEEEEGKKIEVCGFFFVLYAASHIFLVK